MVFRRSDLILKLQNDIKLNVKIACERVDSLVDRPKQRDLYIFWKGKEQAWMEIQRMTNKTFKTLYHNE